MKDMSCHPCMTRARSTPRNQEGTSPGSRSVTRWHRRQTKCPKHSSNSDVDAWMTTLRPFAGLWARDWFEGFSCDIDFLSPSFEFILLCWIARCLYCSSIEVLLMSLWRAITILGCCSTGLVSRTPRPIPSKPCNDWDFLSLFLSAGRSVKCFKLRWLLFGGRSPSTYECAGLT